MVNRKRIDRLNRIGIDYFLVACYSADQNGRIFPHLKKELVLEDIESLFS